MNYRHHQLLGACGKAGLKGDTVKTVFGHLIEMERVDEIDRAVAKAQTKANATLDELDTSLLHFYRPEPQNGISIVS